jgi:hypothetical protein
MTEGVKGGRLSAAGQLYHSVSVLSFNNIRLLEGNIEGLYMPIPMLRLFGDSYQLKHSFDG